MELPSPAKVMHQDSISKRIFNIHQKPSLLDRDDKLYPNNQANS